MIVATHVNALGARQEPLPLEGRRMGRSRTTPLPRRIVLVATAILLAASVTSCGSRGIPPGSAPLPDSPEELLQTSEEGDRTLQEFDWLQRRLLAFHDRNGRFPSMLADVCDATMGGCVWLDSPSHIVDGWGIPVRYEPQESDYDLRSAGPDRRFGTGDDLVYSLAHERQRMRELAGCYRISLKIKALTVEVVKLDSVPVAPGHYGLAPPLPDLPERWWVPEPGPRGNLTWTTHTQGLNLRLVRSGDSVIGDATLWGDVRHVPSETVELIGRRIACSF